jgi:hypothetical protein
VTFYLLETKRYVYEAKRPTSGKALWRLEAKTRDWEQTAEIIDRFFEMKAEDLA